MLRGDPAAAGRVTWRTFFLGVLLVLCLAGVLLFANAVAGLPGASLFSKIVFYCVWGMLALFAVITAGWQLGVLLGGRNR